MRSFYASCTAADAGQDIMTTPIAVIANLEQKGSVVLSMNFMIVRPVHRLSISITNLESEHSMQLSLFDEGKWRERKLGKTMDHLRSKYGSTAILRAVSYTDAGTAITRAGLLGGHKK